MRMLLTSTLPTVAFLGPSGTYSHQAAYDKFGESVLYRGEQTITDVFNALSSEIPLAVVPQENSIFGIVIETYDLLRLPGLGRQLFVQGVVSLAIEHCLVVRNGVKIEEITRILSHEQALGQCRQFIKINLPHATLEKTTSTAAAAKMVLSTDNPATCAAICSRICTTVFEGLEVLRGGIQDEDLNATRFYILAISGFVMASSPPTSPRCALIRTAWKPEASSAMGARPSENITELLVALGLHSTRVDRRPSLHPVPFHDVYFVELQQRTETSREGETSDLWMKAVERGIQRVMDIGGEAHLLGVW